MSWYPGRHLGLALSVLTGVALAGAWWPPVLPVLCAAALLLFALVALDAASLRRQPAPLVTRELPDRAWIGQPAQLALRVVNPSDGPTRVDVIDELPADLVLGDPAFEAVAVAGRGEARVEHTVVPRLRGDRPLGSVVLLQHSPLGLLRRRSIARSGDALRVYPDASRYLRRETLDLRHTLSSLGIKNTRRIGEGIEFETLREYVPGDDPRRLDWAATARRGRPITRIFTHERNHTVWIALDASRLMGEQCGGRTKLDGAIDAALALAFVSLASGDRTGAMIFDHEFRGATAARARRHQLGVILELLRHSRARSVEANYGALLQALAGRQRALVVVLSDFVESFGARLQEPLIALGKRHRVLLVALRSPLFAAVDDRGRAETPPLDLYGRIVVDDLLREREEALGKLRQLGVLTLDATPDEVVPPVVNRYLQLRFGPER